MRVLILLLGVCCTPLLWAQTETVTIGYLSWDEDPRYTDRHTYARFLKEPTGRPEDGAEVALRELRFVGEAVGVEFALESEDFDEPEELPEALQALREAGAQFILADLPRDLLLQAVQAVAGEEVLLFNVAAKDDSLRGAECHAQLLHLIPSHAMESDALLQYLISKKWRRMLVLQGPLPEDAAMVAALERSATRYGAEIVEVRDFVLSNDPREREQNNVALLTGNADYDLLYVADSDGEFARSVPYQSLNPTLVVGSDGLAATAWHWAWVRHGAPQLNSRFERRAERQMTAYDWAAWMGVKAVSEAVLRTESTDFAILRDYILSEEIILDGFKGNRVNFRPWNQQLRQPLLVGTHNWVVARAPIQGFLHQSNNMDTLGIDAPESQCEF